MCNRIQDDFTPEERIEYYLAERTEETGARMQKDETVSVDARDEHGRTALHLAAQSENADMAEFLVARGAKLRAKSKDGRTPLHVAAFHNHRVVAQYLCTKGAGLDAEDKEGMTPAHVAVWEGHKELAALLALSRGRGDIFILAGMGLLDTVRDWLDKRPSSAGARDRMRRTALHWAARRGHEDVAELLLSRGAKVDALSDKGTPLQIAAVDDQRAVALLLVRNGADPRKRYRILTAIQAAQMAGHQEMVELLQKSG